MARVRIVQRAEKEPRDVEAKIVEAIQKLGPRNVSDLSRLTGVHQETIRYKINKRFRKLGFHIHAEVDYRKLGLAPHWAELQLSPRFAGTPRSLFLAMNEAAYLVYYGKLMPQGSFACLFAIPEGRGSEHEAFLEYLQRSEIIKGYSITEVSAGSHPAMRPAFFNFQSNRWDVDWNVVRSSQGTDLKITETPRAVHFDYSDLLLVKELQADALQHTVAIAKKVRVNQKTLEYHYRMHVLKEKLVSGYLVRWQHDIETSVAHSALVARMTFKNLGSSVATIQRVVSKIPFLWAEELMADGSYIATIHIPVQEATSTFDFLNSQAPDLYGKVELSFVKRQEASAFTIPYHMYEKGWKYDLDRMKRPFVSLK